MKITVNGQELLATFEDNSSAREFQELLAQGPLTVEMADYGGFEKVGALIAGQFNVNPVTIPRDTSLEDDLNADSVDIVDLSMSLEGEFGIEGLGEAEATSITTVGDLVRLIQSKID